MILLYAEEGDGNIALPEQHIVGERVAGRVYRAHGHFVEVDGAPHIVASDVEEILRISGYRLATAAEQNEYASGKKKAGSLKESSKG